MTAQEKKIIGDVLERHNVVVGFLFGSAVRGTMGPHSDIDVAVLFDERTIPADKQFDEKLAISSEIANACGVENTDVIILNSATNPVLLYESVLKGEPIVVKDREARFRIGRFALHQYEDTHYIRNASYRILHEQIKSGAFGRARAASKKYVPVK